MSDKNNSFVHLHVHTEFSFLDGANRIDILVEHAKSAGFSALAITDHGNMCGVMDFYKAAIASGIKPIVGCEIYVEGTENQNHHLTVLVRDEVGWRNLSVMSSKSFKENFYYKPRIKKEWLKEMHEGLIVLSGCVASEVGELVSKEMFDEADSVLEFYRKTFGERFFLELQPHNIPEQIKLNDYLIDRAELLGLPLVVTNDVHYPTKDYHFSQEVLMCISLRKTIDDPTRITHPGLNLHLKTEEEIRQELIGYACLDEAIKNTAEIAKSVVFEFRPRKPSMPRLSLKEEPCELLSHKAKEGFQKKVVGVVSNEVLPEYQRRLDFELEEIRKMGFCEYFLVVEDFISWAKNQKISVGPGRGSVAGSLVAYLVGITEIDPIKYSLLFERFLNPDRVSLPDIDVDFCYKNRDKIIEYVKEKYGEDYVAPIATFGTLKARAAIKDVGRVLGFSFSETEKIAQLIPAPRQGFDYTLKESLQLEPKLRNLMNDEKYKILIDTALKLEGLARHSSKHAAGVVITGDPIHEIVPLMTDKDNEVITQFSMHHLEELGLIKYDFLGLETLTFLDAVLAEIKVSEGIEIDISKIPLDDALTYQLLSSGNTLGVFQLESSGIREMLKRLKPSCFNDLIALLALYRPGPLESGMGERYIMRKNGLEEVTFLDERLKPILQETYGIILYQEQIMQIAQALAGYTLAQADVLRKAMGKKNPEEMQHQRDKFVSGCAKNNISQELANKIFDQMETFARYGFNKSHSAAYALLSYRSAYLKAHFPKIFLAVLLTFESGDADKVYEIVVSARENGIKILPPDINKSGVGFTVFNNKIIFGLSAIKGISESVAREIVNERANGLFSSFDNFLSRCRTFLNNKKFLEALIYSGSMDCFGYSRKEMLRRLEEGRVKSRKKNLFDSNTSDTLTTEPDLLIDKLNMEKEAFGFFLSLHPLDYYSFVSKSILPVKNVLGGSEEGSVLMLAGIIQNLKFRSTKRGERYAIFILEDKTGTIEAICWPSVLAVAEDYLVNGNTVFVTGRCQKVEERKTLIVNQICSIDHVLQAGCKFVNLVLSYNAIENFDEQVFAHRLANLQGITPLCVTVRDPETGKDKIVRNLNFKVKAGQQLVNALHELSFIQKIEFHMLENLSDILKNFGLTRANQPTATAG